MYKSSIIAVVLFIAFQLDDVCASGSDMQLQRDMTQLRSDTFRYQIRLDKQQQKIQSLQQDVDSLKEMVENLTAIVPIHRQLLAEQQQKMQGLLQDVDSLKVMVEHLTAIVPTPPPIGIAIPGAPSRFRLVKERKTWDEAEAACRKSAAHLATFADLNEYKSVISPIFKLHKDENWGPWGLGVWVGGRGLGPEFDEEEFWNGDQTSEGTWSGDGFEQVDGTPFPFNTGHNSGTIPWGQVLNGALASAGSKSPSSDNADSCLAAAMQGSGSPFGEVDHSLQDFNFFTDPQRGCKEDRWFICET